MTVTKDETDSTIVSSTLENGGIEKTVPISVAVEWGVGDFRRDGVGNVGWGVGGDSSVVNENAPSKTWVRRRWPQSPLNVGRAIFDGLGSGSLGGASATIAASWGRTSAWPLDEGGGILVGVGLGLLSMVSVTMTASWGKAVGTIISSTLENRVRLRVFWGGWIRIDGRGIGGDSTIVEENDGYHGLQHPRKRGWGDFYMGGVMIVGQSVGDDNGVVGENGQFHCLQHPQKRGTLENRGDETTVLVNVAVKRRCPFFGEKDGAITSSTLKNWGAEMTVPVDAYVEQGRSFCWGMLGGTWAVTMAVLRRK
ncbi:hypothetical protein EV421DRAFT_1744672 [Armillaria borealis]|uniref:Uncharacterized protein n=1 Tax=Armillaria borealis TaxID=47425 RepID=A0AA39IT30_9AGAR|nr:hypothetical protein EV421DRAFT_1744672 [Armillaria borealis]